MSNGESNTSSSTSDYKGRESRPASQNDSDPNAIEPELTEEQLLQYLEGGDLQDGDIDEVKDGTHEDFAIHLNEKLVPFAQGYADPTPSVCLDIGALDTDTDTNSSTNKENLSAILAKNTQSSKSSKSTQKSRPLGRSSRIKLPAHLQAARDSGSGVGGATMSQFSHSKKEASVSSSKAKLPAWMQQVKQPEEDEAELTLDDLDDPALLEELDMLNSGFVERTSATNGYPAPAASTRPPKSASQAASKVSSKLPAWMQQASNDPDELDDTVLDNHMDQTNLAIDQLSRGSAMSRGSGRGQMPAWRQQATSSIDEDDMYSKKSGSTSQYKSVNAANVPSSQKSQESANWTQNRSYFLRMNKMKENNPNKRDWAKTGGMKQAPARNSRDATVRTLTDELDEAKMIIRRQDNELTTQSEQINQLQENQIQEECDRVEAEIARERAENENRHLQMQKRRLEQELDEIQNQLVAEREKLLETVRQEQLASNLKQTQISELSKELLDVKESAQSSPLLRPSEMVTESTSTTDMKSPKKGVEMCIQTDDLVLESKLEGTQLTPKGSDASLLSSIKVKPLPKAATSLCFVEEHGAQIGEVTIPEEESSSEEESDRSSGADYDDRADDEQTVVTFRTGKGRPAKPKISLPTVQDQSSSGAGRKESWSGWIWSNLSNNQQIITNAVVRPLLTSMMLSSVADNTRTLETLIQLYKPKPSNSTKTSPSRHRNAATLNRSNSTEGMHHNPSNTSQQTSRTRMRRRGVPRTHR